MMRVHLYIQKVCTFWRQWWAKYTAHSFIPLCCSGLQKSPVLSRMHEASSEIDQNLKEWWAVFHLRFLIPCRDIDIFFTFFQHGGEPEERFLTCIFVREKKIRNSNFILDCGKSPHPLKYDQVLIHSEDWRFLVEDFFPVLWFQEHKSKNIYFNGKKKKKEKEPDC